MKNRILSFLLMLALLSALAIQASATHPVPDLSKNGSLTFTMDLDGKPLDNGNLNLYKVGEIAEENGNFFFRLLDDRTITQESEIDQILAEEMLTLAKELSCTKLTAPIKAGKAVFAELPVGLYVVWQNTEDATTGLQTIRPFLISVPSFQNGSYEMDVQARPKNAPETIPPETTEPTQPPSGEKLPQTGQLTWPIPLLAITGVTVFAFGWWLYFGRREEAQ